LIKEEAVKIEKLGVRITDIYGAESIEITPDEHAEHGVTIKVTYAMGVVLYGVEQFGQHIDALRSAHAEAAAMAGLPTVARGPWSRLEDVPAEVTAVYDREDDTWDGPGWVTGVDGYAGLTTNKKYGPFRLAE
jgi:hypothetical protein